VQAAENAWNTRDPERRCPAYTSSDWRNRDEFQAFLCRLHFGLCRFKVKGRFDGLRCGAIRI